ncbi:MAG: DUF4131 domain-containing protein, partial [Desulfofustis sp.]|nr:DUF4131 domain-containing protein [Desulfofustis sp.]
MISVSRFCTHYLLTLSTISYSIGILVNSDPPVSEYLPLAVLLAGFPAIFILMGVGYEHKASIFVVLIYLLLGLLQSSEKRSTLIDSSHLVLAVTDQQQVVLVGTLAEMITKSQDINRALIKVKYAKTESNQPFTRASGSILLLVEGDWPAAIGPGHSIIVRTKIQIPRTAATPGSFNYRKYLARKKIFLTGLVSSPVL